MVICFIILFWILFCFYIQHFDSNAYADWVVIPSADISLFVTSMDVWIWDVCITAEED